MKEFIIVFLLTFTLATVIPILLMSLIFDVVGTIERMIKRIFEPKKKR